MISINYYSLVFTKRFLYYTRTSTTEHIKENINAFNFLLTDKEIEIIGLLNREERIFNIPFKTHEESFLNREPEN